MRVRQATVGDARRIEEIRVHTWRVAYRHVFPPERLDAMPVDGTRWAHRIAEPPPGWAVFVAEAEGRVVGFSAVGPSRDHEGPGELYAIYVEHDAWSTGAGRALLGRAEAQLAKDYELALLWVLEDNDRARRFYERAGWELEGLRKVESFLDTEAAEVRYRKQLPDRHELSTPSSADPPERSAE